MASSSGKSIALIRGGVVRVSSSLGFRPQPSLMSYPGLQARPWWDALSAFPELERFSETRNLDALREEYAALSATAPSDYTPRADEHSLHKGDWGWHSAILKGRWQASFASAAPKTTALLSSLPSLMTSDVPFSYAFFSTLAPGAHIAPHFSPINFRVRIHVPILTPAAPSLGSGGTAVSPLCALRVAGETRAWEAGKLLAFDDAYEHEAFNRSAQKRVVLLFDLWHPDLSADERRAIAGLFDTAREQGWLPPSVSGTGATSKSSGSVMR